MSEENKIELTMMESFVTYENKGAITVNPNYFSALVGKTSQEAAKWLSENIWDLYVDADTGEIFPSNKISKDEFMDEYGVEEEDLDDEGWNEGLIGESRIPMMDYFSQREVISDRIKAEEKYFIA